MKTEDIAIVIPSCDNFSDLWEPFYAFFFKYWPDCPYKIYHGSNYLHYNHPKITSLVSNHDEDWSTRLKCILNQIQEKYVIIILEDYFIYEPVNNKILKDAMEVMEKEQAFFMKICCWPTKYNILWKYEKLPEAPFIGKIKPGAPYKICTQIAAWNRKQLIDLIHEGESIWQFETNGSKRADALPYPCLCLVEDPKKKVTHGPITYLCTAISKGLWMRDALALCKKEGIPVKIGNRKIETQLEYYTKLLYARTPLSKRKYFDFIKYKFLKVRY